MKVTFVDPITGKGCPKQYDPLKTPTDFSKIPEIPGIYIYGLKLFIKEENMKKFVPLYVGITGNLKIRMRDHYKEETGMKSFTKEMFDFTEEKHSLKRIKEIYRDMMVYDQYGLEDINNEKKNLEIIPLISNLIYYQNQCFYNKRWGINTFPCGNANRNKAINNLNKFALDYPMHSSLATSVKDRMCKMNSKFVGDYYFVYSTLQNHIEDLDKSELIYKYPKLQDPKQYNNGKKKLNGWKAAECIETATKKSLQRIGINTTAKHEEKYFSMDIDLTFIQENLINTENHNFGIPYKNLIIKS